MPEVRDDASFAADALESLPSGFIVISEEGHVVYANHTFASIYQQDSPGQERPLIGVEFSELLSRGSAMFYETHLAPSLHLRGRADEIALELLTPGGARIPVLVNAVVRPAQDTVPARVHISIFIARQRKLYEAELVRARQEFQQLADIVLHSADGILRCSAQGEIESWNDGAAQIFGYSLEQCKGRPLSSLFPRDEEPALAEALRQLGQGMEIYRETLACHIDGRLIDVSISLTPFVEAPGTLVGFSVIVRDTTARKQAEKALLQSEKLAAVGRLASSVAHEINNPLEAVTNLVYLCRGTSDMDQVQPMLEQVDAELRRVSNIVNQTLRFHKQASKPQEVRCSDLFSAVLVMYEGRLKNANIVVQKRKRAAQSLVVYEGDIRQVLNNLIGNAIDAMPQGGRLLVRSRNARDWHTGQTGIALTVADTGTGITPEQMEKIFEAFFTTKGISGTGLGLWISQEIIRRHHGQIRIRSSQGQGHRGTVATIFLPLGLVPAPPA